MRAINLYILYLIKRTMLFKIYITLKQYDDVYSYDNLAGWSDANVPHYMRIT